MSTQGGRQWERGCSRRAHRIRSRTTSKRDYQVAYGNGSRAEVLFLQARVDEDVVKVHHGAAGDGSLEWERPELGAVDGGEPLQVTQIVGQEHFGQPHCV